MVKKFEPKKVICLANSDRFKYTCKNIHRDAEGHEINNTYRFNQGVPYLVKNLEDYEEMISLEMFKAFEEKEETAKEKKEREKAEEKAKKAKEKAEKEAEAKKDSEENKVEETKESDGADSIIEPPVTE